MASSVSLRSYPSRNMAIEAVSYLNAHHIYSARFREEYNIEARSTYYVVSISGSDYNYRYTIQMAKFIERW